MSLRKVASLLLMAATSSMCWASAGDAAFRSERVQPSLTDHEQQLWIGAIHDSKFAPMSLAEARSACDGALPPEALATPDPLIDTAVSSTKVTVSFIVGTDGRVHSPLILEGLGPSEDRIVLDAVRNWRYRPATCHGIPTEAEGKIAFSSR
jgi:TonB family protein